MACFGAGFLLVGASLLIGFAAMGGLSAVQVKVLSSVCFAPGLLLGVVAIALAIKIGCMHKKLSKGTLTKIIEDEKQYLNSDWLKYAAILDQRIDTLTKGKEFLDGSALLNNKEIELLQSEIESLTQHKASEQQKYAGALARAEAIKKEME